MDIQRINTYTDPRFSRRVLNQHGCFLVDGTPCEIEIISDSEAVIHGGSTGIFPALIEEFCFYAPHITRFYSAEDALIGKYPAQALISLKLTEIQPSQFFVDEDKLSAISDFIRTPDDIIIPVMPHERRFVSLDGHTRLYYACLLGWDHVRAVQDTADDGVYRFIAEARKRNVSTPADLRLLPHDEYEEKWNRFCDRIFAG